MARRVRGLAALVVSLVLVAASAAPVAAEVTPNLILDVTVDGYTPPAFPGAGFSFQAQCVGQPVPLDLGVTTQGVHGRAGFTVPAGAECRLVDWMAGDAGPLAFFGNVRWSPGVFTVPDPSSPLTIVIQVERFYDGSQPEWDVYEEVRLQPFTATRALVNRNGGLTVSGQLWCDLRNRPFDSYIGVSWEATQYVGRKTAITARYDPAIATGCYEANDPDGSLPWATLGPGTQDAVMWIYSPNGNFAAGTVHLEIRVEAEMVHVAQWWGVSPDPSCGLPPESATAGYHDWNGDGFCAYGAILWGAEQFDLRAERAR